MMFEGSENAPKGEHSRLLRAAGATNLNASTSEDRTNYYEVVPPSRLNLALWLEADRMRSLQVTAEQLAQPAGDREGRAPPARGQLAVRALAEPAPARRAVQRRRAALPTRTT